MTTYIFGHKNPDTDSVCSSIALSYLKNALGEKTVPKVLGTINNETKFVLDYFKVDTPSYLNDVKVRIKNIKYDKKAIINENRSIDESFKLMQKQNVTALPLVDDKKHLTGFVTLKELARFLIDGSKDIVDTSIDNIIETLNAKVITKVSDRVKGQIKIAGLPTKLIQKEAIINSDDILIVGNRYKLLDYAISRHVSLIILPLNVNIDKRIIKKAEKNNVNIIATEYDSYEIATKIILSNPIMSININKSPITVNNEDYYSDFKNMTHKVNHTNYPVVNNKGDCLGLIRLTGPNTYEKQRVILVDHNNLEQSVDGIDEAIILEVIDHHNLGAMGTPVPINFLAKPVGCTASIIYDEFLEEKVTIPKNIAGLMLSAILSDTLLFTSPTTTDKDIETAKKLANIAKVDAEKYGLEMLTNASSIKGMSINELIRNDFKSYNVGNKKLGIGIIMTMDFATIEANMEEIIAKLNEMVELNYDYTVLFITDIIKNGSYVICNDKSSNMIKDAFGIKMFKQGTFLPKVVSRKKQMLPSILSILEGE